MKNNIEKVYGKLPKKVNLKNHKVDLSIMDDYFNWKERAGNMKNDGFDLLEEAEKAFIVGVSIYETGQSVAEDGLEAAKDLGIDIMPYENKVNEAKENAEKFSKYTNLIDRY